MTGIVCATLLTLALISPVMAQSPPKNRMIDVAYVTPKDAKFKPIYDRLRASHALETLQEFLAPLRLPTRLTIKVDQCGATQAVYKPQGPVTVCYEYIALIEQSAPMGRYAVTREGGTLLTKEAAIAGAFVHVALYEVANAAFDLYRIPVWGNREDAADYVAGMIMLEFGDDVAWLTLLGTSWFFAQRGFMGQGDFTDVVQPIEAKRYYNLICIAYGGNPTKFAFIVKNVDLPKNRVDYCSQDYRKLRHSFIETIMPHIDQGLLAQVRAQKWIERLKIKAN
jgi:hypothetical protein